MDHAGVDNTVKGPEQYLKPGEKLLRVSEHVGIKKFVFTAYITDRRVFLIDRHEKKPGVTSKDLPREVIISSILESAGDSDPFLVLSVRTTDDEIRTMKIAFIQDGEDRVPEIEDWINILHGRSIRPVKSYARDHEAHVPARKEETVKIKSPEKRGYKEEVPHGTSQVYPAVHHHVKGPLENHEVQVESAQAQGETNDLSPEHLEIFFCHHCGKRVPQGANFCPYCGTKLHRSRTLPISKPKKRESAEE
jgi:hypothetical protein